ncbi:TetR family transcriptional regulator [Microbacterium sp. ASV49]|uniref:TetR family transcriptional regulator n=1 Tax=Microbacterium candidum TaxID=3041922 RepID=A0ABT7MWQ3_9MICO|nr:TetR family transcriptional regulator [Microbacterium sp. ASV49]MDL9978882.1 TetR family transcriptional regulator [Microbacterium sp. ASV49]
MPEHAAPARRRGRPRGRTDTRQRIVAAAGAEFSDQGYEGATMRGIAARAGVDAALLHHYFGTKADLFGEVIGAPVRPDIVVAQILEGPRDEVGERFVRFLLEAWDKPDVRRRGTVILRTAIGNKAATPLLAGFLSRELLSRIADSAGGEDADLRAALVATQVAGLLVGRYLLKLPALAEASNEVLIARVGPTVQAYFAS